MFFRQKNWETVNMEKPKDLQMWNLVMPVVLRSHTGDVI